MQFWPRKRANREYPRIRSWADSNEAKILCFPGYKAGMTHVIATNNRKNSVTKGLDISIPVTIIECPPVKIASVRFHKENNVAKEFFVGDDKFLARKIDVPKKAEVKAFEKENIDDYDDVTILIHTQPNLTNIGKKKPEIFEVHLGGSNSEKINFIKENIGKNIKVSDVLGEGDVIDTRSVTTGKGNQGPVKRFGISLKSHKSEKGRRRPGSLGGWSGQQHFMYRVAMAGQTGYQQRTQYNNLVMKVGDKPGEINAKGGFVKYGEVKNEYLLIKGSVPGPKKRLVVMTMPLRKSTHVLPTIQNVNTSSKQGN